MALAAAQPSLREQLRGERPHVSFDEWRPGDQRYFVSDTRKFEAATGWNARTGVDEGVGRLYEWLRGAGV